MKTILIPLDLSPASRNAFRYALHFYKGQAVRLILLHVYTPGEMEPFVPIHMQHALIEAKHDLALEYFATLEQAVSAELLANKTFDYQIKLGTVSEQILFTARKEKADLVVVGSHGSGGELGRNVFGSTATNIIQRAKMPVVVVPAEYNFTGIQKIAYATNFEQNDIRALDHVLEIAKESRARVYCVHIRRHNDAVDTYKQLILREAYGSEMDIDEIEFDSLESDNVAKGLLHYTRQNEIDLLVMLTHRRSLIGQLFYRSNSKKMALMTHIPLWAFPMVGGKASQVVYSGDSDRNI
ncbi:MAG: universal stress protein [Bacteroidota bacterium]